VRAERTIRCIALALCAAWPVSALPADETSIRLADGPGRDQAQASCSMCHSLDYIVMNSPFQDRAAWEKTVTKMIKVYGAPLSDEDAAAIVSYLDRSYGK
jgi:sulfite dehydrogenase (cytochrome) subunit B